MKTVLFNDQIQKVPIKIWSPIHEVESHAIDQLKNISSLPFVFKHVAAMPDVHLGKGATVGSVIATKNAVVPAAVGVDIGCGMIAARISSNPDLVREKVSEIRSLIESVVPVGHHGNAKIQNSVSNWAGWKDFPDTKLKDLKSRAMAQLGTLGGGNHFIELCTDTEGAIWVMLHSGSRNVGKTLAGVHIDKAKDEMKKMFISLRDPELAYFVQGTDHYREYMRDLMWAQQYAKENREEMMRRVLECIEKITGDFGVTNLINCHHNYASMENHYGENVLITRKGAVSARAGEWGIIPGSMGAKSYIVRGLGNPESFNSCSHGAGRKMSRSEAKRKFTIQDLRDQTAGVDCRKDEGVIDEIPGAYKDIDQVMENQKDLVSVAFQLKQFMCIKG